MGPVMHEVIGPDMVGPLCAQPDAGAVVEPQTAPLRLLAGHLQPLAPPQALDPLVVDQPAGVAQQGGDPAIAVTTVPAGQLDHVRDQAILVVTAARDTALGRALLSQHPAGAALRDPEPATDMVDALAAARGAHKFPWAASLRICLSSVRSETARRSRSFSFSSAAEAAELVAAHPAVLLAPPVVSDLADPQLPDRVRHRHALAMQHLHLPLAGRRSPPACSASLPSLVLLIPIT